MPSPTQYLAELHLADGEVSGGTFQAVQGADLPASGVAAGTYVFPTITVDATGRVTSASGLATPLPVTSGGTGTSTQFAANSLVFAGASGVYTSDTKLVWDPANKFLGIGTAAPTVSFHLVSEASLFGIVYEHYVNSASQPIFLSRKARGTAAVPLTANSGDGLMVFNAQAHDGTTFRNAAGFSMVCDAAPGGGFAPGRVQFLTTSAAGTNAVRMKIDSVPSVTFPNGTVLQNTMGRARNTADVTNVTTTLANLADLSLTLIAGRKYTGRLVLALNDATAADGFKLDLNGGSATMTSIEFGFSSALAATVGTRTSTALATAVTLIALGDTSDVWVEVPVTLVCNAAGTIIPRQAKNSDAAGATLTVRVGSFFWLEDMPA